MVDMQGYKPGGDQKAIKSIADKFFGSHRGMFDAHGWEWAGQRAVSVASTKIVERYGSIKAFELYYLNKPDTALETANDLLAAYAGAWMKGFWGWSPETWGCVGYPSKRRRLSVLQNDINTRIMFIYVTKSAKGHQDTPEHLINRIVGFYELSECIGHRNEFQAKFHHNREPEKWVHSIKAKRAFTIRDTPLPYTYEVEPNCKKNGWGTRYGMNSDRLSDVAYEYLKGCTYEEVPVFGSEYMGLSGLSFPNLEQLEVRSRRGKSRPVAGGAPNNSGYYVRPEADSRKSLYILELCGDINSFMGRDCEGQKILKVGLSFSPESRKDFFNRVIPKGKYSWKIIKSTQIDGDELYSCHAVAEKGERAMKEFFHRDALNHLGGEFYLADETLIEDAWKLGRSTASNAEGKEHK